ncbi:MAG: hypothetical protein KC910_29180 [Candidatus Eremiobacteraeota bacterium]|nr:hypothetical protein [Candidatus Eremiobacteraeota bacterium]
MRRSRPWLWLSILVCLAAIVPGLREPDVVFEFSTHTCTSQTVERITWHHRGDRYFSDDGRSLPDSVVDEIRQRARRENRVSLEEMAARLLPEADFRAHPELIVKAGERLGIDPVESQRLLTLDRAREGLKQDLNTGNGFVSTRFRVVLNESPPLVLESHYSNGWALPWTVAVDGQSWETGDLELCPLLQQLGDRRGSFDGSHHWPDRWTDEFFYSYALMQAYAQEHSELPPSLRPHPR